MHWSEQSLLLILLFIYTCLVPAIGFALHFVLPGLFRVFEMRGTHRSIWTLDYLCRILSLDVCQFEISGDKFPG